jgi:acylphosphatase
VTGDDAAVAAMIEACREGPFSARVAEVAVSDDEDDGSLGFTPRPTI